MSPREVAFSSGRDRGGADRTSSLISQVRGIVRWQLTVLAAVCAVVVVFLPSAWSALRWPLAVVLVAFVVLYPSRILLAALQGLQDLAFLGKTQIAGWAFSTVATVALVLTGGGLYSLVIAWMIGQAIPACAAWYRIHAVRPELVSGATPKDAANAGQYLGRSVWLSAGQIAQVLLAGSDVLLIGKLLGPAAVVPYACTGKLVMVFANHPQLLMHAAQPALSELRGSASRARLAKVSAALAQTMLLMSGGLAVVVLAVNQSFTRWWVGDAQFGGWALTAAFVLTMLMRHWSIAVIYTLFCFGHERRLSLTSLADGIVTIAATIVLVRLFGPIGAPLGSLVGVITVTLPFNIYAVAHEMGITPAASVTPVLSWLARIVPVAVVAAAISAWVQSPSFAAVAGMAAFVGLVYGAVMFPLVWNGPAASYVKRVLPVLQRMRLWPLESHGG